MPKVLFTSVCRPLGPEHGDGPTVGYELLFRQVTRAQGLFSPRALHLHFSLEYVAQNLDAPAVVLQYPSKRELIRELKKGYDYVGVSFLLPVFHRMKETVALIRKYAPKSKIVLGGYGTILGEEVLKPYGDFICREEGVTFMRRLLGETPKDMPYNHPLIVSKLKLFSLPVSNTGMIFAGLGCPNGCDFCCTSHFFERKHIKLLPTGGDIHAVIERYLDLDPDMSFTILDEDFLLNKRRAMEFRDSVLKAGKALSIFAFASLRALNQYKVTELLEMGIDGLWIGYEGTRSGFAKQAGRPASEVFPELRRHGITVLASMIVGFDYQDKEIVAEELDGLLSLEPCLSQFLIYNPIPGTPFHARVAREGRLIDEVKNDPEYLYRRGDGFRAMIKHPRLSGAEIEELQRRCFEEDYRRLGPSVYRVIDRWLSGYRTLRDSGNPMLRKKAERFAREVRNSYPTFLAGKLLAVNAAVRERIESLEERAYGELGAPTLKERLASGAALAAAAWTGVAGRLNLFQHPSLTRTSYRLPEEGWGNFRIWETLPHRASKPGLRVQVELQHAHRQVWMRLEGAASAAHAKEVWEHLRAALAESRNKLVLDLQNFKPSDAAAVRALADRVGEFRSRVKVVLPKLAHMHPEVLFLAQVFKQYKEGFF
mgnify:CR=1 FL=1